MAKVKEEAQASSPEIDEAAEQEADQEVAGEYKLNPRLSAHAATTIEGVTFTHDEPVELTQEQVDAIKGVKVTHFGEEIRAVVKA